MADFFEIDFLNVEAKSSGDAICIRYEIGGLQYVHVVDGGFQATGDAVVKHINVFYGGPALVDHVVATHNDGDHAVGLQAVLEHFDVGALWMLRPWIYAAELLPRFKNYSNVENLRRALRSVYGNLAALEDIADRKGIPIYEPFQGAAIGHFRVMAPTRQRFLDLVVDSDKTPAAADEGVLSTLGKVFVDAAKQVSALCVVRRFETDQAFCEGRLWFIRG